MADFARLYMLSSPEEVSDITASVASKIENKTLKFADFIASVQEYAVDDDLTIQAKSIGYISTVLALFKPDTLSRIEISVLVAFFRTRIEDNAGVKEASQGLRSLLDMTRFMKKDVVDIVETIFKSTADLQRQPAPARFAIYHLVEKSLERCREVIEGMSERFIDGILSLVEFEKEPRNLMIVFSVLRVIMAEFAATERQTEALWDSVFRYYPITFNPKPGDKIQVTKQDLQKRLEACITSNSRFASYALPSLLAKLDQELSATIKIEVLRTMASAIENYSSSTIVNLAESICRKIEFDVFGETDTAQEAAKVLAVLFTQTFNQTNHAAALGALLQIAQSDILNFMRSPTTETSRKACVLIKAVGCGSPGAFCQLLKSIMPSLLTIWQAGDGDIASMGSMLNVFNGILDDRNFCSIFPVLSQAPEPPPGRLTRESNETHVKVLQAFKDSLLQIYDVALCSQETSIRIMAVKGQLKMALIQKFLSYEELAMIVETFSTILLNKDLENDLRQQAMEGLLQMSRYTEEEISTLPAGASSPTCDAGATLVKNIVFPAFADAIEASHSKAKYQRCGDLFKIWGGICLDVKLFEWFLEDMRDLLVSALNNSDILVARMVLASLKPAIESHILRIRKSSGSLRFPLNNSAVDYFGFGKQLCRMIIDFDENEESVRIRQCALILEDNDLTDVGYILMLLFRSVEACQKDVAAELFTLFGLSKDDDVTKRGRGFLCGGSNLVHPSKEYRRTAILSRYILASLRPSAKISNLYDFEEIALKIITSAKLFDGHSDSQLVGTMYAQMFGLLVNKFGVDNVTIGAQRQPLNLVVRSLFKARFYHADSMSPAETKFSYDLAMNYTHAMVKKGDREMYLGRINAPFDEPPLLKLIISFLAEMEGHKMAAAFGMLVDPSTYLSHQNHALIRGSYERDFYLCFYREVVCIYNSPRFVDYIRSIAHHNCTIALGAVLKMLKGKDFLFQSNPITTMIKIIDTYSSHDSMQAAIDVLTVAARSHRQLLVPHYKSIVERLLRCINEGCDWTQAQAKPFLQSLLQCSDSTNEATQAKAIRCLACIGETSSVQQKLEYSHLVLRALNNAFRKLSAKVRTEANDCANIWSVPVPAPNEDSDE